MGIAGGPWPGGSRSTWPVGVLLAGLLATGVSAAVSHRQPVTVRTGSAPAADLLAGSAGPPSGPPVTSATSATSPTSQPPPAATPVTAPRPSPKPTVTRPAIKPWRPAHPQADYMGATVAAHPGAFLAPGLPTFLQAGTPGIDVSNWQGQVNWTAVAAQGIRFAYIKATEATTYTDPRFGANYTGSADAGLIRGAYHFAVPNASSGATQANYFVDHGGSWVGDGRTLPPALDIEYDPYGPNPCYGLTAPQMTGWVSDFATTVYDRTGRWPVIYTTTNWWSMCTGNSPEAGAHSPLWLASWTSSGQVRNRPAGWGSYTVWQYADRGMAPGDQDYFHGSYPQLQAFAARSDRPQRPGGSVAPPGSQVSPVSPPTPTPTTPHAPVPATVPRAPVAPPLVHTNEEKGLGLG